MSDQEPQHDDNEEVLRTFDMYHFFSRKDVLLAIAFIVILLAIVLYKTLIVADPV